MAVTLRPLLVLAAAGLFLPPARAQTPPSPLDPESKSPYVWRIVLHTRPHPLLDSAFRDQVRREVLAALQPALGPLAVVEFVDLAAVPRERWEPLWRQFDERGWPALAFDSTRELSAVKTHLLHVEFQAGAFQLEAQQLDGFTGLPSPVVRRQTTRVAGLVGRTAGLMLDRDFGLDGTVEPDAKSADEATIRFRGAALGSIEPYVKVGDVFAVAGVRKSARPAGPGPARTATGRLIEKAGAEPPPAFTAVSREFTLLRVTDKPKAGAARVKVLTGYPFALPLDRGVIGYRCLRLPTVEAPLALKLVGKGGVAQRSTFAAQARANDIGWAVPPGGDELELRDGVYRSARSLGHVAFVTLSAGSTRSSRVPVAVVGAEPIAVPFILDPADERRVRFERDCYDLVRRVAETRTAQAACFDVIARFITARRNADALARGQTGIAATELDSQELTAVLARLHEQAAAFPSALELLAVCDRQLADVQKSQAELAAHVKSLESIVARENDPVRAAQAVQAEALLTRIKVLLERGDVDEAVGVYDQLITLLPADPAVKAQQAKLKAEAVAKSEEHAKAREVLNKSWPALATIPDMRDNLPAVRGAVDQCIALKDRFALRKFLTHLTDVPLKLNDLVQPLDAANETDRRLLTDAKTIRDTIEKLDADVRAALMKAE